MHLCDFNIINLRCISHASVELHKNINLIVGKNGSGQNFFFRRYIFVSNRKKLQRSARRLDLIRDGSLSLGLAGLFVGDGGLESKIKLEKSSSKTSYTFQGQSVKKTSEVAAKIPVLVRIPGRQIY